MPYRPDLTDETVNAVAKYLFSIVLRPHETDLEDEVWVTVNRKRLWDLYGEQSPVDRFEDFYEALRILADGEFSDAVEIRNGTARTVLIALSRIAEDWEPAFYDDTEDFDGDIARAILTAQGYDIDTVLPDVHRIMPNLRRDPVVHDPAVPRTCSRCKQTLETHHFARRGREGTPGYNRFTSQCLDCVVEVSRAWRKANPGADIRDRSDRRRKRAAQHGFLFGSAAN